MAQTIIRTLATYVDARTRCRRIADGIEAPIAHVVDADGIDRTRDHWIGMARTHEDTIATIAGEYLPSGSGVDNGTTIDLDRSTAEKIVLHVSFHHMDESGSYDGWTEHTIVVRPSLIHGIELRISGRDRNGIKDYLHDLYAAALAEDMPIGWRAKVSA